MTAPRALALAIALVLVAPLPAAAQRASLADRVAALELRAANPQNVDLVNQIAQLRTEIQALRGQLEEAQQANEQLRNSMRTQYLDVDGRLQRLEGSATPAPAAPAVTAPAPAKPKPAATSGAKPAASTAKPAKPAAPIAAAGSATPTGGELAAYNTAFDALKAGSYADASRLFADFLDRYPGGVYAPNALYWLGESYYATHNYAEAIGPFTQLLDRFPTHDKAPGALLKLGLTRQNLHDDDAARGAYADVVARYPGTDAARSAADRLRALGPGR
ncbi:tol-pal system protein YbgF [Lysobacter sp. TY2-98]|uniref:tol-pal system protein YbgF n=1 Tax=Lysobacter sp. TY2-98 TaxID=2290922 RepID=UPI000E2053DB|nr:tol-pal system protein YbgF [Lysobacter sp. TY2-98]AXK73492.1 tol-pal system protein YbgF [Lysobacter sp. TY2-98]